MERSWIHLRRGWIPAVGAGNGDKHEELITRQGFEGRQAIVYHSKPVGQIKRVEGNLRERAILTRGLFTPDSEDATGEPTLLLHNSEVAISLSRRKSAMPFCYRNAVADLLYFVHRGTGIFATEFGPIAYEPGDYVLLPKGISFRHMPETVDGVFLIIETRSPIGLTNHDQIGRHWPFDLSILQPPEIEPYDWPDQPEWELKIKHAEGTTSLFYDSCPFDIVGWKGDFFPFKLNIRHIMPLMSEHSHLAPPAWATFDNADLIVATIQPMIGVANMSADGLPANHRNVDCDEVFLIHDATAFEKGLMWHTPQALVHGASAEERDEFQKNRRPDTRMEASAVNIDVFKPLIATNALGGDSETGSMSLMHGAVGEQQISSTEKAL